MNDNMKERDALLVIDVQNDFCPGGALPIENGDAVIGTLNGRISEACSKNLPVFASRDWHPAGHVSFVEGGGPWPAHCLQDHEGACFHPELELPPSVIKVTKGVRFDMDQNSAFAETGLSARLEGEGVKRVWRGVSPKTCACWKPPLTPAGRAWRS